MQQTPRRSDRATAANRWRTSDLRALALLTALCAAAAPSSRATDAPETVEPDAACATSECHAEVLDYSHLHWPELAADCRDCHIAEGDAHDFETEEAPESCAECHAELAERIETAKLVHEPAEDDCMDCHDAHGSEAEGLLASETPLELCLDCHDEDEVFVDEYEHGPVAKGACSECHDPHTSPRPMLLRASGRELCGQCHEELVDSLRDAESIHEPAEDDCTDCHNPHSGPYPNMLPAEKRELCRECHDDIVEEAELAEVDHSTVLSGEECLHCHSPHGSDHAPTLKQAAVDLCLDCHDDAVESNGSKLTDMKHLLAQNSEWHEPITEDGCHECHNPHGSDNFRLLRKAFPEKFYAGFDRRIYALCFSCHERRLVTAESTRTLTEFRDGDRNLHFLHVNRAKKGRTCRACHDLHATTGPLLVRETVPFGKWQMPIQFEKQDGGGSCEAGCHRARSYSRDKP